METLEFKTNLKCEGCLAKVSPALNASQEITDWKVDLDNPDKILVVSGANLREEEIQAIFSKEGFNAVRL